MPKFKTTDNLGPVLAAFIAMAGGAVAMLLIGWLVPVARPCRDAIVTPHRYSGRASCEHSAHELEGPGHDGVYRCVCRGDVAP